MCVQLLILKVISKFKTDFILMCVKLTKLVNTVYV